MKKLLLTITCLSAISSAVVAQPMSPAQQGFAYQEQMRMRQQYQQQNYAAQQRAQQRRQQAYINRMRNKKWYGAIVTDVGTFYYGLSGGHRSRRRAIKAAQRGCRTNNCQLVTTFANTCVVAAAPKSKPIDPTKHFLGVDKVGQNAIIKAIQSCEAVYGKSKCDFIGNKNKALCSGYEYNVFNSKL